MAVHGQFYDRPYFGPVVFWTGRLYGVSTFCYGLTEKGPTKPYFVDQEYIFLHFWYADKKKKKKKAQFQLH
ncbi:hypothetical protein BpHYR1_041860 [Brachionus plicatilis]|uniref:Uncharacterized protein n=1 Tax=Brachionus plicatilis TaxID=10195 RepID=A0A3M7Q350_BRAPC|nr:hypothetical protein BpHYR1_041860 [Brachionus plicatilis]